MPKLQNAIDTTEDDEWPSIFAFCPVYGRVQCLADTLYNWERMIYPGKRELLIYDDSGQYMGLKTKLPETVTMISTPRRFACFGEKQNAACSFSTEDQEMLVVIEDDDYLAPWTLLAHADAFKRGVLSVPRHFIFEQKHGRLDMSFNKSYEAAHAGWAYSRHAFRLVGGYPWIDVPTDHHLLHRLRRAGAAPTDGTLNFPPYLVNRLVSTKHPHLSRAWGSDNAWRMAGRDIKCPPVEYLPEPDLSRDYEAEIIELCKIPSEHQDHGWKEFFSTYSSP